MLPDPLVSSWTSNGLPKSVTTPRNTNEGDNDYKVRHEALVRVLAAEYAPDGGVISKNY